MVVRVEKHVVRPHLGLVLHILALGLLLEGHHGLVGGVLHRGLDGQWT